jgi:hypothetical protein
MGVLRRMPHSRNVGWIKRDEWMQKARQSIGRNLTPMIWDGVAATFYYLDRLQILTLSAVMVDVISRS